MTIPNSQGGFRVVLMQPYFFPYLGYFSLIRHADLWVVFDSAQFMKGGWIERNRILHPNEGWSYIRVPLMKHPIDTPIVDVRIRTNEPWREKLLAQLAHYKKVAPYYAQVLSFLKEAIDTTLDGIAALNVHLLVNCCRYLEIPFDYITFSTSSLSGLRATSADEWGLETAKALGATEYLNSPGGITFYDQSKYDAAGVKLTFIKPRLRHYDQRRADFVSSLSIIDVMMFNEPSMIRSMLDEIESPSGGAATTRTQSREWEESRPSRGSSPWQCIEQVD